MQIVRTKRRVAAVAAAAAGAALIAGSVAVGSHRPQVGLLADATTLNEVHVKVKGSFRLKTTGLCASGSCTLHGTARRSRRPGTHPSRARDHRRE